MPLPRLIPCLDVAAGRVVKGVRFQGLRDVGDPTDLGERYSELGADELVFLDVAATLDCVSETGPTFTTTVAVCVTAIPSIVADTVFEPDAVDDSVPVTTPLASVVPTGWVNVFPAVGVAVSVTVAP